MNNLIEKISKKFIENNSENVNKAQREESEEVKARYIGAIVGSIFIAAVSTYIGYRLNHPGAGLLIGLLMANGTLEGIEEHEYYRKNPNAPRNDSDGFPGP